MSEHIYLQVYDHIFEFMGMDWNDGDIWPTDRLLDDLGMDSLDAIELVMWAEEKYDIEIPDLEAEKLHTVYDVVRYLEDRMEKPK
jgi:acyl carrier protein